MILSTAQEDYFNRRNQPKPDARIPFTCPKCQQIKYYKGGAQGQRGYCYTCYKKLIKNNELQKLTQSNPNPHWILSQIQHEALTGSMLGDGHLTDPLGYNSHLRILRALKDQEYLEYERLIFKNLLIPSCKDAVEIYIPSAEEKEKGRNSNCSFCTRASSIFTAYREYWYPNGKKAVPSDLQLTSTIIAHWFADDGHISTSWNDYRFRIELSTHCFAKDEVYFLAELLNNRYNEYFKVGVIQRNKTKQYIILAQDSATRVMIKDIDPYFKLQRKRIWEDPKTRFYNDPPERQKEIGKIIKQRKKITEHIMQNTDKIGLKELANELGLDSSYSAHSYIRKYIDSGEFIKIYDKNNKLFLIRNKKYE